MYTVMKLRFALFKCNFRTDDRVMQNTRRTFGTFVLLCNRRRLNYKGILFQKLFSSGNKFHLFFRSNEIHAHMQLFHCNWRYLSYLVSFKSTYPCMLYRNTTRLNVKESSSILKDNERQL